MSGRSENKGRYDYIVSTQHSTNRVGLASLRSSVLTVLLSMFFLVVVSVSFTPMAHADDCFARIANGELNPSDCWNSGPAGIAVAIVTVATGGFIITVIGVTAGAGLSGAGPLAGWLANTPWSKGLRDFLNTNLDRFLQAKPPVASAQTTAGVSGRIPATSGSYPPVGYIQVGEWYEPLIPTQETPSAEVEPVTGPPPSGVEPVGESVEPAGVTQGSTAQEATSFESKVEPIKEDNEKEAPPDVADRSERIKQAKENLEFLRSKGLVNKAHPDVADLSERIKDAILKTCEPRTLNDPDKWMSLPEKDRETLITKMSNAVKEELGVRDVSGPQFLSEEEYLTKFGKEYAGSDAVYDHDTKTIFVNTGSPTWKGSPTWTGAARPIGLDSLCTIIHELRHAQQWQVAYDPGSAGEYANDCRMCIEHRVDPRLNEELKKAAESTYIETDAEHLQQTVNDTIIHNIFK